MTRVSSLFYLTILLFPLFACENNKGNAFVEVWLTDAPGDYEAVHVEIKGVEIHTAEGDQASGWIPLNVNTGVINLLTLTNGLDTLIGSTELPAGRISQIRLKLGNINTITVNGETFALKTPSGQQSGLKLQVHKVLGEGITYKILLDFDAARSVIEGPKANYALKPVIRTITEAQSGAIRGIVSPVDAHPVVYAVSGSDTIGSVYADGGGKFLLRGLPAGDYTVGLLPSTGYSEVIIPNITVSIGNVSDVGVVEFEN